METMSTLTTLLIITNVVFSYYGFVNADFFDDYAFDSGKILARKDYKRLITSGFLHVNWTHLVFNMLTLYAFGSLLEIYTGARYFSIIYLCSLLGGNFLALYIHRREPNYLAVGASGAVNGVIFASIALMNAPVGMMFIPIYIPAWIFALFYTFFTLYGIQTRKDNIGHEAHLGGAFVGLLAAILYEPRCLIDHTLPILIVLIPTAVFLYLSIKKPEKLILPATKTQRKYNYTVDDRYNAEKVDKQKELDRILEKIHRKGMDSLSKEEKDFLNKHAN